jgi:hypothetical protein
MPFRIKLQHDETGKDSEITIRSECEALARAEAESKYGGRWNITSVEKVEIKFRWSKEMEKFYITYGYNTHQRNNYSVLEANDYADAHQKAVAATGGKFAFCYTERDFSGSAEEYGLSEIPLQPQKYIDD